MTDPTAEDLQFRVRALVDSVDLAYVDRVEFLGARFDAGLAWVHFPIGAGGLGLSHAYQTVVDAAFRVACAPGQLPGHNQIGLLMAAPTIAAHGTEEQLARLLRPLWTGVDEYCQLFSEPGAGSDLANMATRAVRDGDEWVINGQKVWTSSAHTARRAILVARNDIDLPKHRGLTYFVCDMSVPGVEVRPLRQLTGEAEFNEVFLTDVRIRDADRLGSVGDGWRVANTTLNNERIAIGGGAPREDGMIGRAAETWRQHPELRRVGLHDRLISYWVEAEVFRLSAEQLRQRLAVGQPGPEGSAMKLTFARLAQTISGFELELLGPDGLRFDDWTMVSPDAVDWTGRDAGYRYLRAKGNSIEGGTSEILRNVIAERVLGLPRETRADKDIPWKDVPR